MTRRFFMATALGFGGAMLFSAAAPAAWLNVNFLKKKGASFPYGLSEAQWRKKLGEEGYRVLRDGENETAGTSPLLRERRKGVYACAGCDTALFGSSSKMMANDYPTFRAPLNRAALGTSADFGIILPRTEVHCKNCGSHLGYKFMPDNDGRAELWRYVINGVSLAFHPA